MQTLNFPWKCAECCSRTEQWTTNAHTNNVQTHSVSLWEASFDTLLALKQCCFGLHCIVTLFLYVSEHCHENRRFLKLPEGYTLLLYYLQIDHCQLNILKGPTEVYLPLQVLLCCLFHTKHFQKSVTSYLFHTGTSGSPHSINSRQLGELWWSFEPANTSLGCLHVS